jgi:hypothetical protein
MFVEVFFILTVVLVRAKRLAESLPTQRTPLSAKSVGRFKRFGMLDVEPPPPLKASVRAPREHDPANATPLNEPLGQLLAIALSQILYSRGYY